MLLFFIIAFIIGAIFGFVKTRYYRYKWIIYAVVIILLFVVLYSGGGFEKVFLSPFDWINFGLSFFGVLMGISLGEWYAKKQINRLPSM